MFSSGCRNVKTSRKQEIGFLYYLFPFFYIFENFESLSFKSSGLDLSDLIGGIVKAFIVILPIVLAVQILGIGGTFGAYLGSLAAYLPRFLAG